MPLLTYWKQTMNIISKSLVLTAVISMLSGCALSTAPKNSTYWAKEGVAYQTHKARIIGHDAELACKYHEDAVDLDDAAKEAFFKDCMTADGYVEIKNPYDIKETGKKSKAII